MHPSNSQLSIITYRSERLPRGPAAEFQRDRNEDRREPPRSPRFYTPKEKGVFLLPPTLLLKNGGGSLTFRAELSYCHMTVDMRFQLNFKSGKPVYLQLVDQVKVRRRVGRGPAGRAAAVDPPARRGAARQPQHRGQGVRRARKPGRHRDRRRQGLLRPREQLAVQEGSAPRAPDAGDRRRRRAGAPPSGREGGVSPARRRSIRRVRTPARRAAKS